MKSFMESMEFRHACKKFYEGRKISKNDMEFILEAGRLSPSSFGLEHTRFLVISNRQVKEALRPSCWNQPQINACSHFVVLLSLDERWFESGSSYLEASFARKAGGNSDMQKKVTEVFDNFIKHDLRPSVDEWSVMQSYIASANMMTAAASIGIDSCPIEGFNYTEFLGALKSNITGFDFEGYNIAYAICFGYRANEQTPRLRMDLEDLTTYVE